LKNFKGLVTLTLDRVILHPAMHHSPTTTYMPNFIEIEETFCRRTDGRTFEISFIRSTLKNRPNKQKRPRTAYRLSFNPVELPVALPTALGHEINEKLN